MANKTDNLNLTLPLGSERPDINVLNENFERVDSAYGQEREERINTDVELAAAINAELERASSRENAIENALNDEVSRAKSAESANSKAISNETIRATDAENELAQNLSEEIERAQEAERYLEDELSLEITRATLKENEISENLSNEITRAKGAENTLADNLDAEILRAKSAEKTNAEAISNESVRATEKENEIATNLSTEVSRATGAESVLTNNLNAEITRAKTAEKSNTDAIIAETTRATAKENEIDSNLSSEITRAKSAESELNTAVRNEISRATQKESALESSLSREISRAKDAEKSNADSLATHSANQSNPHAVTKEQVGLGNVPNVTTNDQTPSYTESSTLSALTNGEKLSIAFGKIAKAISSLISHLANTSNPHKVTKSQVGLGNVDNTSDTNKPVSTAQQSAIDLAYANSNAYTDQKISELINGAPTTLDTLGEIASAMAEHEDVVSALNEAIGKKANQTELDTHTGNDTIHITANERTNWNDANSKKHTHGNKSILDTITQALIDSWNSAFSHITDTVKHITADERISWNAAKTHADSAHAPSDAQANVIETLKVNGTALTPSSKSVNIPVPAKTSELTNDSGFITKKDIDTSQNHTHSNKSVLDKIAQAMLDKLDGIEAGANAYIHPSHTARSSGLYKITVDGNGHVSAATAVTKADITGLGIPGSDTNTHYASKNVVGSSTATNNTTSVLTNGNVYLNSVENGTVTSTHKISGSGATTVTTDANGNIVISSTDNNTTYSAANTSANGLMTSAMVTKLNGITDSADSVAFSRSLTSGTKVGTITINGTGTDLYAPTNTDTHYTSHLYVGASGGNANATTATSNPYLLCVDNTTNRNSVQLKAGSNMSISAVNGVVTFSATNTTYGTGNASTYGLTKLYTGTGTAVDGTMTQAAITNAISAMVEIGSDITV